METFFAQITSQAPAMCQATLEGFFNTIITKLQQKLIDEDYVSQARILSDLELRVINQLLCYNFEQMDLADEQEEDEIPKVDDIFLTWMDELAIHVKAQLTGGEMVELSSIHEELGTLLKPMDEAWHGCYHCGSFFQRSDWISGCLYCDGWLLVEVESNDEDDHHEFMYAYTQAVPWEFRRLCGGGVSALKSFEEFEMVDTEEGKECPNCKSDDHEDGWKITSCKHIIGYSCLKAWLEDNLTCPVCRSEFPGDNEGTLAELFDRSRIIRMANAE